MRHSTWFSVQTLCYALLTSTRGFIHEKHTPAACCSYHFSFSCASEEHRYQSRHDTLHHCSHVCGSYHTRNMSMLPFQVSFLFFKQNLILFPYAVALWDKIVSLLLACLKWQRTDFFPPLLVNAINQNKNIFLQMLLSIKKYTNVYGNDSVGLSSDRAGHANA